MHDIPWSSETIVKAVQKRGELLQWERDFARIKHLAKEIRTLSELLPDEGSVS